MENPERIHYITTTFPGNVKTVSEGDADFAPDSKTENHVINLYPEMKYQTFRGFGGAFTESAGYVYSLMTEQQKKEMLETYFTPGGLNYTLGRIPLDSCDFSLDQYAAMNDPNDREMKSFSIERTQKYIIPLIRDAEKVSGKKIQLMATPWSPPAFMKTNSERIHGGHLKEEYAPFWADYICRYIKELRAQGLEISVLSVQNEPAAVQTWDSCIFSAEEEKKFLKDALYPALKRNGLDGIEIFIWDHNKERAFERACAEIDSGTDSIIDGVAFHWYSGDHFEALDMIRERFPKKRLILSEACIEYYKYSATDYLGNAQRYAHDMIGNMNAGMDAFYDWNLLLNEAGGPNYVNNLCDAPYLYDTANGRLIERNTLPYIRHFSHYIKKGAVRIGMSRYTSDLEVTAFQNTDGVIAAVILNTTAEDKETVIRMNGGSGRVNAPAGSISTVLLGK